MYDLILLMPCSTAKEKYKTRLDYFKEYGLLNIGTNKIKMILLVENECDEEYLRNGWKYDTEIIKYDYWHPAPKIYNFFSNLKEDHLQTKWLFKLDDDSITNVSDLLNLLNSQYDYTESLYIMSVINCKYINDYYQDILKDHGLDKWLGSNHRREFECSFMSQKALYDLKNCERSKLFLQDVVNRIGNDGFGDCVHSTACREAGSRLDFLTHISWLPMWTEFINKELYHIHFIYNRFMDKRDGKNIVEEFNNFHLKILFSDAKNKIGF